MPTWVVPVITVVGMIFSAGITWGVLTYRQKRSEDTQSSLVKDLKECVTKLQSLVTEVEVMKASNLRYEKQSEDHDKRISALEIAVVKLGRPNHRKR